MQIDIAIVKYTSHLVIENDGQSMTMHIAFTAWTPELAAAIVNAHMEAYQSLQQQAKAKAARRANAWLDGQIEKLRGQLRSAEAAVTAYRAQHHLTGTAEDRNALSQQLAALTAQLIAARAELAENQARAEGISGQSPANAPLPAGRNPPPLR